MFCRDPFWDTRLAWSNEPPHFTECFENTVLVYLPTIYIWGLGFLLMYGQRTFPGKTIPFNLIHIVKLVLTSMLITLYSVVMYRNFLLTSVISTRLALILDIGNCVFVLLTQVIDRNRGHRSSGFLFTYWAIQSVCELPQYYRQLMSIFGTYKTDHLPQPNRIDFILAMLTYPIIISQLLLSSVSESAPPSVVADTENPLYTASPASKIFFAWMTPLIAKGYKKYLTLSVLYPCPKSLYCETNYRKWKDTVYTSIAQSGKRPSLTSSLFSTVSLPLIAGIILEIAFVVCRVTSVLLLNEIILYLQSMQPEWKGYLYVIALFLLYTLSGIFVRHADMAVISSGIKIKSVLLAAIYRKSLKISSTSLGKYTIGELVNLLSVDADKVNQLANYLGILVAGPVQVIYTTFLLYIFLGPSCFAGIAVIFVMMPITAFVAKQCRTIQDQQMKLKDVRLKYMSEILNSMKIIKFYAWEHPFIKRVEDVRQQESNLLKKFGYYSATMRFLWFITPFLVSLLAFTTYVLINGLVVLEANLAFVSLSLFNGMRFALSIIPDLVSNIVQTTVSIRRIEQFLSAEELRDDAIGDRPDPECSVSIKEATMAWDIPGVPVLYDINFRAKIGRLVAIVGRVGSGKSSLLQSMLGSLHITSGTIDVDSTIAYVPQQAWIQNATIKQNILFTKHYDKRIYSKIVEKCCLKTDFEILPGGENTEIGEKGVNLSGGQKQRISLARAVYQDRDMYLLDDPLSAVDSHVGSAIFNNVIGPRGVLRKKTRIFVTNDLALLPDMDFIYVLSEGRIAQSGTYGDLLLQGGAFAELLKENQKNKESDSENALTPLPSTNRSRKQSMDRTLSVPNDISESTVVQKDFRLIDAETVEVGGVKMNIYTNYIRNIGAFFIIFIIIGFSGTRVLDIASGIWLGEWAKDDPDGDISDRNYRIIVYALIGFGYAAMSFVGTANLVIGTLTASRKLHNRMLYSIMRAPMAFFDTTPMGRILNRFGKDVDQLDIQLPQMANLFLELFLQLIGMLVLISINLPIFVAIAIPMLSLYIGIQHIYLRSLRQLKRLESVTRSPVYNHFSETISGISSIRAYNVQNVFIGKSDDKSDTSNNCSFLLMTSRMWMTTCLDTIGNALTLSVLWLLVSNRGNIDPEIAGFIASYTLGSSYAFVFLIHYGSEVETAIVASERLDEYSRIPSEAPWNNPKCKPKPDWPQLGTVEFNEYSARYRPGLELVLKSIELQIKPGEKIGVVGRTGAGKSSLTLSLFRIIEAASGNLVIDEIDIARLGLHDLRSRIAIIPQEPVIFSGTLRLNLDPHGEFDDADLYHSLERCHMKNQFSNGLDTEITEGGQNLSVGQRQLVCLARAVLRKRRILVMDEATAAVDVETDALIQETIRKDFANCTVITIAHRLNTIIESDRVVVMADGKIIEQGSPQDLLNDTSSHFYSMAKEAGLIGKTH